MLLGVGHRLVHAGPTARDGPLFTVRPRFLTRISTHVFKPTAKDHGQLHGVGGGGRGLGSRFVKRESLWDLDSASPDGLVLQAWSFSCQLDPTPSLWQASGSTSHYTCSGSHPFGMGYQLVSSEQPTWLGLVFWFGASFRATRLPW